MRERDWNQGSREYRDDYLEQRREKEFKEYRRDNSRDSEGSREY